MKGLSQSFISKRIIVLTLIVVGLFGGTFLVRATEVAKDPIIKSTVSIVCQDQKQQDQAQECIYKNGFEGDLNNSFNICIQDIGLNTCSASEVECSDEGALSKFNECILACNGDSACATEQCSEVCPLLGYLQYQEKSTSTCKTEEEYNQCAAMSKGTPEFIDSICGPKCTCTDPKDQESYELCLQTVKHSNPQAYCAGLYKTCSSGQFCGTITSMPVYGIGSRPIPTSTNYCAQGQRSKLTSSIAYGTKGCNSINGCAQWSCLDASDAPLGSCIVPYTVPSTDGVCGVANGGFTTTFPSTSNLCSVGTPFLQSTNTNVISNGGTISSLFSPNTYPGNVVYDVTENEGKYVVVGAFGRYGINNNAYARITRLNSDGSLDTSFNPGAGANDRIYSVSTMSDGKLLIAGAFTQYNNTTRKGLARLNSNGSLDTSFNPTDISGPSNSIGIIYRATQQLDGRIIIVGNFMIINNKGIVLYENIARLNSDGSLDTSFNPNRKTSSTIFTTLTLPDGKILIGGTFTNLLMNNGTWVNRSYLARLNSDGSLDTSFNPTNIANNNIWDMVLYNNKLILVGAFTNYGGSSHNYIAQINLDGSVDNGFSPSANNLVFGVGSDTNGNILLGGNFTTINGSPRKFLAAIDSPQSVTTYNWSCTGFGSGSTVSCNSYQISNGTTCVPYTGSQYVNTRLPQPSINLLANGSGSVTGIIAGNGFLRLSLKNLANTPQTIQYAEPVRNTDNQIIGGDFYGCQSSGWNVSNPLVWPYNIPTGTNPNGSTANFTIIANITDPLRGYVSSNNRDSQFLAWNKPSRGFKANCEICIKPTTTPTQTGSCTGLPANAIPNIATGIIQYQYATGWYPSTQYSYNPSVSTTSCNFVCATNYTWNDTVKACIANTQQVACQGTLPANTVTIPQNTFTWTQTWNGTTQNWLPTGPYNYEYTCNEIEPGKCGQKCAFMCKENYTWDDSTQSCVANGGPILTCPTFTVPNAIVVRADTFPTVWNGTSYVPQNPSTNTTWQYNPNPGTMGCYYTCNANSVRYNGQCIQKVYHWETMTGACAANPAINGICGTANGTTILSTPSFATLCFMGTPTTVNGNGPWTRSCAGANGGTTATCGANKTSTTYAWNIGTWGTCSSQGGSCGGNYNTAGACGATATSQVVGSYGNGQMPGPYEGMLCRSFTTQSTCSQGRLTHGCSRSNTTTVSNSCGGLSQSQCGVGQYSTCNWNAGASIQTRPVVCQDSNGNTVNDNLCPQPKPAIAQACGATTTYMRETGNWGTCSNNSQTRTVICRSSNGSTVADSFCSSPKPATSQSATCPVVNGVCGTANGQTFSTSSFPGINACSVGISINQVWNNGYTWNCQGSNGGSNSSTCRSYYNGGSSGGGGGCFIADTFVTMADGSKKPIQDITIGDQLKAVDGYNTVKSLIRPLLGNQDIYSINNTDAFFTANHPFLTTDGWKSLDPETTKNEIPDLLVTKLAIGDVLITEDGYVLIMSIGKASSNSSTQLYNFELDGDHTYFANDFAVHNKIIAPDGGSDCGGIDSNGYPIMC